MPTHGATADRSAASEAEAPVRPAWRSPAAVVVFLVVAAAGTALDLVSKHVVFEDLLANPRLPAVAEELNQQIPQKLTSQQMLQLLQHRGELRRQVAPGLRFTLSLNPGVVFGIRMNPLIVSIATGVTIVLVGAIFATSPAAAWPVHGALALILAGALGNWYDRLFSSVPLPTVEPITRHVRDFIDFSQLEIAGRSIYPWIFNVADIWLVIGVGTLMVYWFLTGRKQVKAHGRK